MPLTLSMDGSKRCKQVFSVILQHSAGNVITRENGANRRKCIIFTAKNIFQYAYFKDSERNAALSQTAKPHF